MEAITYTQARGNLSKTIERVCSNHDPVIITKKNEAVVMLSLEDYEALQETAYLLRSPANAQRLLDACMRSNPEKEKQSRPCATPDFCTSCMGGLSLLATV